jgi:hypothetical protein
LTGNAAAANSSETGGLNIKSASLKTVAPSNIIKVSNVFNREEEMTPD